MFACRWPAALLLLCLFSSAILPSRPLPPITIPPTGPRVSSDSGVSAGGDPCPLTVTPSAVVVRFGDPVTANCSVSTMAFSLLGWVVSQANPKPTTAPHLVWSVKNLTDWSAQPVCFALAEQGGQCQLPLPLVVYKPPGHVSIRVHNHTGPLLEGQQYTLLCTVHDVAPVENLTVTFYRGQTPLGQVRSSNATRTPVTEIYALEVSPGKEDDGAQYRCEAELELGPAGPQHPLVATSTNLSATVHFGPQLACPTKLWVKEGEALRFEVRGNPRPLVNWYRDGENVTLPTHLRRRHAGKYTVLTEGFLGQKNFTVEVEVLPDAGTAKGSNECLLLAVLLIQTIYWL